MTERNALPDERATPAAADARANARAAALERLRVVQPTPAADRAQALGRGLVQVLRVAGAIIREHQVFLGIIAAYLVVAWLVFRDELHLFWFAPSELAPFGISMLVVLGWSGLRVLARGRVRVLGRGRSRPRERVLRVASASARGARAGRGARTGAADLLTRRPAVLRLRARAPLPARAHARLAWRYARFHYLRPVRLGGALLLVAAAAPFMSAFVHFKRAIPQLHSYAYDPLLASLSRTLHGGRFAWEWLQPLVGHPLMTLALDRVYVGWYGVVSIVTLWQAWSTNRRLRAQFAVALLLAWAVLGTGLALLWSSAGPIYYGRMVSGPDPFAPLVHYLAGVDARYGLYSSDLQRILWKGYVNPASAPFYEGISAMPSLHVALPVLFVLLARRVHRLLFWVAVAFAALIFVGSVHLAWHYAVDGYVAALGVCAIWWVAGKLVGRGDRRPATWTNPGNA